MTCIRTTGRDPWTPRQARHHNPHFHGALVPMDAPSEPISPLVWLFLAAVASPFIAALAGGFA